MRNFKKIVSGVVCTVGLLAGAEPPAEVRTKVFELPPEQGGTQFRGQGLEVGDCVMFRAGHQRDPAKLTLHSDGRIHFDAVVRSEDSNDEFYIQFAAYDRNGHFLFKYYPAQSPTMPRSSDMGWHIRNGKFDPVFFESVEKITWSSSGCH
ncbi:DUF6294 family protein [Stigmatella sp. ncwal1]|uniref:DUF6294 family protein n=1 Tax=Stigmatella ashevillensis TaxID=2995309 RepID=A0ABT5DKS7_9BACT|nr:DUF6294 family protein [Stigmatella ashevillena]MDC0714266.1 DUF6294 family protein [Stigmatella ashevillena]